APGWRVGCAPGNKVCEHCVRYDTPIVGNRRLQKKSTRRTIVTACCSQISLLFPSASGANLEGKMARGLLYTGYGNPTKWTPLSFRPGTRSQGARTWRKRRFETN